MRPTTPFVAATLFVLISAAATAAVPSPDTAGHLHAGGSKIYYESFGGSGPGERPVLVLIHDGVAHREVWDDQIAAFAAENRVVRYDRRGYGRSEPARQPFSNVEDLRSLLDHLGVRRAVLVGSSSGGGLAVDFTLAYPRRVSALVLVGAVADGFGFSSHFAIRSMHLGDPDPEKRIERMVADPYIVAPANTAVKERLRQLLLANPQDRETHQHLVAYDAGRPAEETAFERLHEISVPTLVVAAAEDIPDVHLHAGAFLAGIAGARRVMIPDAGHLSYMERPEAFNQAVLSFLSLLSLSLDAVPSFERGFVEVRGTHLYYEALGEGPPLILLHGLYLDHRMWDGQFEDLAQSHRVIRFDLRGSGLSRGGTRRFVAAEDLRELMEHLGVEKAHLLGSTAGAEIAVDFALEYPDKVAGLILASPFASGYEVAGEDWTGFMEAARAAWQRDDYVGVADAFLGIWLHVPDESDPAVRERLRTICLDALEPGRRVGTGIPRERPATERWAEIRVPTLVLVGEHDLSDVQALGELIGGKVEGARVVEIPGVAQMGNMERSREFNRFVRELLSRAGG